MHALTDEELMRHVARSDRSAMQVIFARHHVRVFRFLVRLVRNEAMADDLVSEVFIDVWRQAGRFGGRPSVATWLLSIARFKALSALGKRTDRPFDEERAETIADEADDPEIAEQKRDKGEVFRQCIGQLSRENSEIIDLVYFHEQSIEEVADIIGIPGNTAKTRLFYARKRLAEIVEKNGLGRGPP